MTPEDKIYISNLLKSRYKKMMSKVKKIKEQAEDKCFDEFFNRKERK